MRVCMLSVVSVCGRWLGGGHTIAFAFALLIFIYVFVQCIFSLLPLRGASLFVCVLVVWIQLIHVIYFANILV